MHSHEIVGPKTHPYVCSIQIDPAEYSSTKRAIEADRALRLVAVDDSTPDQWTVHIGCASKAVRAAVQDHWV